jgi:cation:H+ antiporter
MILLLVVLAMLLSSFFFSHALEHLGKYLNFSTGFTASVLIAIGTATPELIVPFVAISTKHNEIGVGAVLGSSLMLFTVAFPLCGCVVFFTRKKPYYINSEPNNTMLDLRYIGYGLLAIVIINLLQRHFISFVLNIVAVIGLIALYILYLSQGYKLSKQHIESKTEHYTPETLLIRVIYNKIIKSNISKDSQKENIVFILIQIIITFAAMWYSTEFLIHDIEDKALAYKISAFALSMLIAPIVTELPEKFNSVTYIIKKKDTLAIGNITGALVLQVILLPIMPTLYGLWQADQYITINLSCILVTYLWLLFLFLIYKKWNAWHLVPTVTLYIVNLYFCFFAFLH